MKLENLIEKSIDREIFWDLAGSSRDSFFTRDIVRRSNLSKKKKKKMANIHSSRRRGSTPLNWCQLTRSLTNSSVGSIVQEPRRIVGQKASRHAISSLACFRRFETMLTRDCPRLYTRAPGCIS